MWILACYLAGSLIYTSTYQTRQQCLEGASILEIRQPRVDCRCSPNKTYRPQR